MNAGYERSDYKKMLPIWQMIRDAIEGNVKTETYIFPLVPTGDDDYDAKRFKAYRKRAVYHNFTGRTHDGLVGQVFFRDPIITLTPMLKHMEKDADGAGNTLLDIIIEATSNACSVSRYCLLVDYPKLETPATREQIVSGKVKPTIILYDEKAIINWRVSRVGNKKILTLLVLKETYLVDDDGFQETWADQYRVLRLTEEGYTQSVVRLMNSDGKEEWGESEASVVKDHTGQPWKEIPAIIGGSVNNDPDIDRPVLRPLAELNLGHLRNSADLEESLHMMGQPTPWASGITEQHKQSVMGDEVRFGSRSFVLLPEGGQAGLLTMPDASPIASAMEAKEKRAASLGAKLIESGQSSTTATFTNRASMTEDSVLSRCAKNVSKAFTQAMVWCQQFLGDSGEVSVELSTDYDFNKLSAQERQILIAEWQAGGITDEEYRWNLKRSGVAYLDDTKWAAEKAKKDQENKDNSVDLDREE